MKAAFGNRLFWVCGGALAFAAWALCSLNAAPATAAFTGSAIEASFGVLMLAAGRTQAAPAQASR